MILKRSTRIIFIPLIIIAALIFAQTYRSRLQNTSITPDLPEPPLRELASEHKLELGSFAALKYLHEQPYTDILTSQFSYLMIDGEPNWQFESRALRPTKDSYDFTDLDTVFAFANEHKMPVRYQHLIWGDEKWLPYWLKNGTFSDEELLALIDDHIKTVGERYKGKVREYSVVNEAFSREIHSYGNTDWWGERLGHQYIDRAFISARAVDPEAVLILNDYGNETVDTISDNTYNYIKDAKSRGIPIDAIGMQMHLSANNPPKMDEVITNMKRFGDINVRVYVTEFDVSVHDVDGTAEFKQALQADIYRDMLSACLTVGRTVCPSFGFLGLIDRQSWYNGLSINDADPLLFDSNYTPKPAFYVVRQTLDFRGNEDSYSQ